MVKLKGCKLETDLKKCTVNSIMVESSGRLGLFILRVNCINSMFFFLHGYCTDDVYILWITFFLTFEQKLKILILALPFCFLISMIHCRRFAGLPLFLYLYNLVANDWTYPSPLTYIKEIFNFTTFCAPGFIFLHFALCFIVLKSAQDFFLL